MPLNRSLTAAALAVCCAAPAYADIYTTTGTTSGAPTFNRPIADFAELSTEGTAVGYSSFTFSVGAAGEYSFLTTAGFDSYVLLYGPTFNPAAPTANGLASNDDLVSATTSGFAWTLDSGMSYTYVVTGYANGDAGAFSTTIGGPGAIVPVPEPAAAAMMLLGLAGLGLARRHRLVQDRSTR